MSDTARFGWVFVIASAGLGLGSLASSGCSETVGVEPSPAAGSGGQTFDAAIDAAGSTGGSGGSIVAEGGTCALGCTPDLRSVVDCNGEVVLECGSGLGCAPGGECISACDAADANSSALGCEYLTHAPDLWFNAWGSCYGVLVTNVWSTPSTISVSYAGQSLSEKQIAYRPKLGPNGVTFEPLTGELAPGETAALFLAERKTGKSSRAPCPAGVNVGVTDLDVAAHETRLASAFEITTSVPGVAYAFAPLGGEDAVQGVASAIASATLLLPTSSWGTNYLAILPSETTTVNQYGEIHPWFSIVARDDDTEVTIEAKAEISGGPGVAPVAAGDTHTYTLDRGQVLNFALAAGLAGSPIQANKPIAEFCGHTLFEGDTVHQQILPIPALGSRYPLVRPRDRKAGLAEAARFRFVGVVDQTKIEFDPPRPAIELDQGEVVEIETSELFVAKSQDLDHPFYAFEYMLRLGPNGMVIGDGEFVNVIPVEQALPSYGFFMEPRYQNSHLVIVRARDSGGPKDVKLDCLGAVSGFSPLDAAGDYEWARVDLVIANEPVGTCNSGFRTLESDAPFVARVWGWSELGFEDGVGVSYAYPVGFSTRPINQIVVPPTPH